MTARDLITILLDYDLDAEVVFELVFEEGEPELIEINDVICALPPPDEPEALPLIILSEELPEIDRQLNLN